MRLTITWKRLSLSRRELIVGENFQLKVDIDVYNEMNAGKQPAIQLVLDYKDDVAEREH